MRKLNFICGVLDPTCIGLSCLESILWGVLLLRQALIGSRAKQLAISARQQLMHVAPEELSICLQNDGQNLLLVGGGHATGNYREVLKTSW